MLSLIILCIASVIFGFVFLVESHQEKKLDKQKKQATYALQKAILLLKHDECLRYLHDCMVMRPKNNTQIRQNQRSHIIRDILSITKDVEMTKAVCALADMKSKKIREGYESCEKDRTQTGHKI